MFTHKWRRSLTRDSSTWIITLVIYIITLSYSISPHMVTRITNSDGYAINILCSFDIYTSIKTICRAFLISSMFASYLAITCFIHREMCGITISCITCWLTHIQILFTVIPVHPVGHSSPLLASKSATLIQPLSSLSQWAWNKWSVFMR